MSTIYFMDEKEIKKYIYLRSPTIVYIDYNKSNILIDNKQSVLNKIFNTQYCICITLDNTINESKLIEQLNNFSSNITEITFIEIYNNNDDCCLNIENIFNTIYSKKTIKKINLYTEKLEESKLLESLKNNQKILNTDIKISLIANIQQKDFLNYNKSLNEFIHLISNNNFYYLETNNIHLQ